MQKTTIHNLLFSESRMLLSHLLNIQHDLSVSSFKSKLDLELKSRLSLNLAVVLNPPDYGIEFRGKFPFFRIKQKRTVHSELFLSMC